ncbi:hypothetical protein EVAR_64335_1 [Eumeta japonica]|uniref:Uncharacterized protein n=1 Tax=Eumeta variegata TaxID=151549 RepID=A0A4C1Z8U1_EUMVA|nr:hypothetical protein EVAR_64335_1 [Eumeta japonica]
MPFAASAPALAQTSWAADARRRDCDGIVRSRQLNVRSDILNEWFRMIYIKNSSVSSPVISFERVTFCSEINALNN